MAADTIINNSRRLSPLRKPVAAPPPAIPPAGDIQQHPGHLSPGAMTQQLQELRLQEPVQDETFDPKRGTYIPYGGFDTVLDSYYSEGDPTDLKILAPSQMQRREQSRSPQRALQAQQQQQQQPVVQQQQQAYRQGPPPPRPPPSQDYYEDQRDYQEGPYDPYVQPQHQHQLPQQRMNMPMQQPQQRMMPPRQGPPRMLQQQQQQRPDARMRPAPGQGPGPGYDPRMGTRQAYRPNTAGPYQPGQPPQGYAGQPGPPSQQSPYPQAPQANGPYPSGYPPSNPGPRGRPYNGPPRPVTGPGQAPGRSPPMRQGADVGGGSYDLAAPLPPRQEAYAQGPPPARQEPYQAMPPPQPQQQMQQAYRNGPSPAPSQSRSEHMQRVTSPPVQQQAPATAPSSQRNSARSEDNTDMLMQETEPPVTLQSLNALRREAAQRNDPATSLKLVKKLMEAAEVLCNEPDAKQARRSKDDYNREALRTLKQITSQEVPFPDAVFFLANCYGNGALALDVDHQRAFAMYESAAKQQHAPSAYRTAVCLEIGAGTKPDVARAVRFYERAANYGDVAAMYKLGMILLRGLLGQQPDSRGAIGWLQKAADKATVDNPHALHELALLYEKGDPHAGIAQHEQLAKDLFTRAAKLHYAPSQFRLGYAYEYGTLGCPADPRRSIAWYSRGAERGDPESELALSGWYLTGSDGVLAQNDREAYLWGRKAAERGLAKAEFAVGYFYESGIGTEANTEEAIKWYKRAATAGQKKAQDRLLALTGKKPRR